MLWDSHVHTTFSGDGHASPEEQIETAMKIGLPGLTFTDHTDFHFPPIPEAEKFIPDFFLFDPDEYQRKIQELKLQYPSSCEILTGVELGLQLEALSENRAFLAENDFDFVIGSIHVVEGADPYYEGYWQLFSSPEEGIRRYFTCMLDNLRAFSDFDSLGHLDYIARYAINFGYSYEYMTYLSLIKEIFSFLIQHEIALELNTGGFRSALKLPNPGKDLLQLYHDMGGRLITTGSDAHYIKHLGLCFDEAEALLRSCGFTEYMVYRKRTPHPVKL